MNKITDKIFLGDWEDANSFHFLTGNEIKCVFNVCREVNNKQVLADVAQVHYPMVDGHPTTEDELFHAVKTFETLVDEHDKVLIHCLAGISRSATVLGIYLAWKTKVSFDDAINFIAKVRPIVNPNNHFMRLGPKVLARLRGY